MSIRNLDYLFRPRSVAVVGATDRAQSVGATVMMNLIRSRYAGTIMPVNPKYRAVAGLPAFHSLSALPAVPDMAILCTPPRTIPDLIDQLGRKGTKAAIVLTAGVASRWQRGAEDMQQAMLEAARPYLLRILGPNCIGLVVPGIGLNASFAGAEVLSGKIAFVSQSGALTTAVLDWAASNHVGFSKFVSVGNSADVDFGDLLDYLASDPDTRSILLYIESIKHARKFMSAARSAARNKPVIVVKAGRSTAGAVAAASHTGAMAGSDVVFDAAVRRAGMLRVDTTQDLFSAIETLSRGKPIQGERLLILTNGGGPGVMAADAVSRAGGQLAVLSDSTLEALDRVLPSTWSRANPIDIIGDASVERYGKALSVALDHQGSDALLLIHAPTAIVDSAAVARECAPLIRDAPGNVLGCWLGGRGVAVARQVFAQAGIPTYQTPEEAVQAFMQLLAYRRNQELLLEVPPSVPTDFSVDADAVKQIVDTALQSGKHDLNEVDAKAVLAAYGIPVVDTRVASDIGSLEQCADAVGFPAALKILSPDISHKSDVGGVVLNLASARDALVAARDMVVRINKLRPEARIAGFTLQPMIDRTMAHELILGVASDGIFGPVILFGHGGTATELINDRAVSLPPLNMALAKHLVGSTRVYRLLQGYRDRPQADLPGLYAILVKLSQLVIDIPEIQELDINPLLLDQHGAMALDARIRIGPTSQRGADRLAIQPYPKELEEAMTLEAGKQRAVLLRPIVPGDGKAYQDFLHSLSLEDARYRFFCSLREMPESELARVTQIDYSREMTFVAAAQDDAGHPEILGEIRLVFDPDNQEAEMGIAVSTGCQSRGLGFKLLSKAVQYCRQRGTARVVGTVIAANTRMLDLARKLGFILTRQLDGVIGICLNLK